MYKAVILSALQVEYAAVRAHLKNIKEVRHPVGTIYEKGIFQEGEIIWEVGLAETGKENDSAAVEAERAIRFFDPEVVLFVGVAGGFKTKDVRLGDVVIATEVFDYDSAKAEEDSLKARPSVYRTDYSLGEIAKVISRSNDWLRFIMGETTNIEPDILRDPIASGNKVITSKKTEIAQYISEHYNNTLAVEMEGKGFLRACYANTGVKALLIRGISDFLDNKDEADKKGYQEIASRHAAAAAFAVLAGIKTAKDQDMTTVAESTLSPDNPLENTILDTRKTVGRSREIALLHEAFRQEDKKVFIITGLAGIGKSTLVSKFLLSENCPYNSLEYFIIDCRQCTTFTAICRRLSRLFNFHNNTALAQLLAEDKSTDQYQELPARVVSQLGNWLLIFDNFEELLEKQSQEDLQTGVDGIPIDDLRLENFFKYLFTLRHQAKIIITSRYMPRLHDDRNFVCCPLEITDGKNEKLQGLTLEDMKELAPLLLKSTWPREIMPEEWRIIDKKINGHPQAFGFLCSLLNSPRKTTVSALLQSQPVGMTLYRHRIHYELLGQLINSLDEYEKNILYSLCVLRKPFNTETATFLQQQIGKTNDNIREYLFRMDERSLLEIDIRQETWIMHAVVRDYLYSGINTEVEKSNLHRYAAEYYLKQTPRRITRLEDIETLEEAYYHYSEANLAKEAGDIADKLQAVLHRIGMANYYKNSLDDAARALDIQLKYEKEDWRLYFYMGNLLRKKKKPISEIAPQFTRALQLNIGDLAGRAKILQNFGVTLKEAKQYDKVIDIFEKALAIDADNPGTLQEYAALLRLLNRDNQAEDLFKKIPADKLDISAKTEYARTLISLACKANNPAIFQDNMKKATDLLVSIIPKDAVVYNEWARAIGLTGNQDEKIKILMEGLTFHPQNMFLLQELATTYNKIMNREKNPLKKKELLEIAQQYNIQLIDTGQADYIVHCNYAKLLKDYAFSLNNADQRESKDRYYDAAEAQYKKALTMREESRILTDIGNLLRYRNGRQEEAKKYLEHAIRADEKNYHAHLEYALFLLKRGEHEESNKHYQKALSVGGVQKRRAIENKYQKASGKHH